MNVETLVFIYIYLSICVITFDIFFVIYNKYTQIKIKRCISCVNLFFDTMCKNNSHEKFKNKNTVKKLSDTEVLIAFHQVAIEHVEKAPEKVLYLLMNEADALVEVTEKYSNRSVEQKAYLAYIIGDICGRLANIRETNAGIQFYAKVSNILLRWLSEDSLYVRENALKAILGMGDPNKVVSALEILNRNGARQNEKLICDRLLEFWAENPAVKSELTELIWNNYSRYTLTLKLAVINYIRLLPKGIISEDFFNQEFYHIIKDESLNKEIRLAALRYFRKYRYNECYPLIQQYAKERYNRNWELRAVAVSVLENYPHKETIDILVDSLASRNWYVRFNSAESLLNMGVNFETLKQYTNDSFALEMMNYRNEVFALKERRFHD